MRALLAGLLALCVSSAAAQQPVRQSSTITPGHPVQWTTTGVIQDAGTAASGSLTGVGVTASGPGICQNSGPITSAYNQICLSATASGGSLTFANVGGATGGFTFNINGTSYSSLPIIIGTTPITGGTVNDCLTVDITGTLLSQQACVAGGSIALGVTTVSGGVDKEVLFDDAGFINGNTGFTFNKATASLTVTGNYLLPDAQGVVIGGTTALTMVTNVNLAPDIYVGPTGANGLRVPTATAGENVGIGFATALAYGATASQNVAIGGGVATAFTTGSANVFLGHHAGRYVDTTTEVVAIGESSLSGVSSQLGSLSWAAGTVTGTLVQGVGIATGAIVPITITGSTPSGYNGTYTATITDGAIGSFTFTYPLVSNPGAATVLGFLNTNVGGGNIAIGSNASSFTIGTFNTAVGYKALRLDFAGTENVAMGHNALSSYNAATTINTQGYNTAIGGSAASGLTTGQFNVSAGFQSGGTGASSNNVFIGLQSGFSTTTNSNVIIGSTAGFAQTSGGPSIFIGGGAGASVVTATHNIFIGHTAGSITTSADNTFLGYNTGATNTTGAQNTLLGSGANTGASAFSNATAIGYNAVVNDNDTLVLGKTGTKVAINAISATAGTILDAVGNVRTSSVRGTAVTVANLPATPVEGMLVAVTDSTTVVWGATITGGNSNHVLAYYNGSNWTVAGK